ncbi:MAG: hypothetical protein HKN44_12770 [Ilumatobacter sp.]|nr:hypothetical protein [Ilumatobacter sp.]
MFNLQGSEIIVILLLALVVLGPEKLPDAVRKFSRTYAELKKMGTGFQSELKSALDEPMREMRETADLVMDAADPQKLAEQAEAEVAARAQADAVVEIDERAFLVNDPGFEQAADGADPAPVNQIAAANASAAIDTAARQAAEQAAAEQAPAGDASPDGAVDDVPADPAPPSGPVFHSAAPRPSTSPDQPVSDASGDDAVAGQRTDDLPEDAAEEANAS